MPPCYVENIRAFFMDRFGIFITLFFLLVAVVVPGSCRSGENEQFDEVIEPYKTGTTLHESGFENLTDGHAVSLQDLREGGTVPVSYGQTGNIR